MPPESEEEEAAHAETSPLLLMPSAHSTDRPSHDNLAALQRAAEEGNLELRNATLKSKLHQYGSAERLSENKSQASLTVEEKAAKRLQVLSKALILIFITLSLATVYVLWSGGVLGNKGIIHDDRDYLIHDDGDYLACRTPFSLLNPVLDLEITDFQRPETTRPSLVLAKYMAKHKNRALPTNSWYQNFLLLRDGELPSSANRAYAVPYILDAAGPVPGLRIHTNDIGSSSNVIQINVNDLHGITMGVVQGTSEPSIDMDKVYSVQEMTQLAVSLEWSEYGMTAPIVKGMPYGTVSYADVQIESTGGTLVPAIVSEVPFNKTVLVDQKHELNCTGEEENLAWVEKEIELYIPESDFTWLVFVSEPVQISCKISDSLSILSAIGNRRSLGEVRPFFFRTALFKPCTKGVSPVYCHQEQMRPDALHMGQGDYGTILRKHAHLYPGPNASVSYDIDDSEAEATLLFDWNVQAMSSPLYPNISIAHVDEVITFALPHHLDMMKEIVTPSKDIYCAHSLIGPACLVEGSTWSLSELMPNISFRADRPPTDSALPFIFKSLEEDIEFRLPDYYQRGAGDTYFSGKMLAKLGRILMIVDELQELCSSTRVCDSTSLPSKKQVEEAVDALRSSVEIWINGTAETPFVYDSAWGGFASCGCLFDDHTQNCSNIFPDCPGFSNPGLNFGNAFYNDMHFHYGYHIFGAAVVSYFDPNWGRAHFEKVLLLVRSIANPSEDDGFFPVMRHKDVYQGHSWASGIATAPLNGRNQESSSESLAAYESVALYGKVMASVFEAAGSRHDQMRAVEVRRVGMLMTASELRAAKKYYHVKRNQKVKIYPDTFTPHVVGIMWQTMAQFQTWFGNKPFLATGIQLLPLTPIAGQRDEIDWAKEMYPLLEESCKADVDCEKQGWSVLQLGALSTVGHRELALSRARLLAPEIFESAGGNGHSMTNTLWYISTREPVTDSLPVADEPTPPVADESQHTEDLTNSTQENLLTDCYKPETCTDYVLDTVVELYTCRQRIIYLMQSFGLSQKDACVHVAAQEFPDQCGQCNPLADYAETLKRAKEEASRLCPPCSVAQCQSDLNRCPIYEHTYVCTKGPNEGGCSGTPWLIAPSLCLECCSLKDCQKLSPLEMPQLVQNDGEANDDNCPICTVNQMESSHGSLCPVNMAPYLCTAGASKGGCSPRPWSLQNNGGQCHQCCKVTSHKL